MPFFRARYSIVFTHFPMNINVLFCHVFLYRIGGRIKQQNRKWSIDFIFCSHSLNIGFHPSFITFLIGSVWFYVVIINPTISTFDPAPFMNGLVFTISISAFLILCVERAIIHVAFFPAVFNWFISCAFPSLFFFFFTTSLKLYFMSIFYYVKSS